MAHCFRHRGFVARRWLRRACAVVAGLAAVARLASPVAAAELDVSLATHYSTGDYGGSENIDVVYVPFVAKLEIDAWMLKAVLPFLRISGGTTTVEGPGGPIVTPAGTEQGFGDIIVESTYTFDPIARYAPFVEVGGRIKFPTAEDGLGTGEFDFTPEIELSRTFGRWTPYLGGGYRVLGDSSYTVVHNHHVIRQELTYRDGFVANAGLTCRVAGELLEPGMFVYWKQAASSGADDAVEALPVLRIRFAQAWVVDTYLSVGFTDSVPDIGSGVQVHYVFSN